MDIDDHALKRENWAAAGVGPDFLKSYWAATETHWRDFTVGSNQRNGSSSLLRYLGPSATLLKLNKEKSTALAVYRKRIGEKNKGIKSGDKIPPLPLPHSPNICGTEQHQSAVPNSSYCSGAGNIKGFKINVYNQQKCQQTERL